MRVVALSDLHIGHRRYPSTTDGRNTREVDIEEALTRALENVIAAEPDAVLVPGDIVDHPRVSVHAIVAWREFVRRVVDDTDAWLIAAQGNHDAAKTRGSRTPIVVPGDYERVEIVTAPKRVRFEAPSTGEAVAVSVFPFTSLQDEESYSLDPAEDADVNLLMIHAPVKAAPGGPRPVRESGVHRTETGGTGARGDLPDEEDQGQEGGRGEGGARGGGRRGRDRGAGARRLTPFRPTAPTDPHRPVPLD